ncbi:MAG: ABC transporter substrate-binding protein [Thermoprotei archaeon]
MQKIYSLLIVAIFLTSATLPALAANAVLQPSQVSTWGPRVNELVLEQMSDSSAFLALDSGEIQAMEWSLTTENYASAQANHNFYTGSTPTYAFDAIVFNTLMQPINSVHFRRAIAYLTNYTGLQSTLGATVSAGPQLYNPILNPVYYDPAISYPYNFNTTAAEQQLLEIPGMTYNKAKGEWLYNGTLFMPSLYYRSDDPLRTAAAEALQAAAQKINLTIAIKSVTGTTADTYIYGPASSAVVSPGVMGANYSTVTPPVYNYTYAKLHDTWDMYTIGWIVSSEPTWPAYFLSSEFAGIDNYGDFYNPAMDYWSNLLLYGATNTSVAKEAADNIQQIFNQQLPYVMLFYTTDLYAVENSTWSGYALIPSDGPSESTGLYYTSLNVHPTGQLNGGTFTEALHGVPTSLDPLYAINWIWQVDVWQEIYDSPVGTPPTGILSMGTMPWMATWSIQNDTTTTLGNGTGWWNPFHSSKIMNGQVITLNFYHNMTWQDGVPVTAYDYNFSLYFWNVPGVTSAATPEEYASAPPYGLLATYIPPNNPYQIKMYINSTNLWNFYSVDIPVIPEHIFEWFNPSAVATTTSAMDTTLPASQISGLSGYLASNTTTLPAYVTWLPNLEVGSGAFYMPYHGWNEVTKVITLYRNTHYYRSAWWAFQQPGIIGKPFTVTAKINESVYNPTSSAFEGIAPSSAGTIPITNATGYVEILSNSSQVLAKAPLTNEGNGVYSASLNTASLAPGLYEVFTNATYDSFGLQRYWYTFTGANLKQEIAKVTNIALSSSSVTQGQPVTISAEALSFSGVPMSGQKINFAVNGTVIGSNITNSNGVAIYKYTPTTSGKFTVSAASAVNSSVSASTAPAALTVAAPTNWALYGGIAVVIIVIVAIAAYFFARPKKKPEPAPQK